MIPIELFKLFGSILIDNDKADKSIAATDKKAETLSSKFSNMIGTAAKWGATLVGAATVVVGGMVALVNKTSQAADEIDKLSIRTGISRTQLQELRFIAGQTGVSFDSIQGAVTRLTTSLGQADKGGKEATATFKTLGVQIRDNNGQLRSSDEIFNETIKSLASMDNTTERNILGQRLFGKGFTELIPLIDQGADGIETLTKKAHELGIIMSDEAIKANVEFSDSMDQIKQVGSAVFAQIGTQLIPVLMVFLNWVLANMPQIRSIMETVFGVIGTVVGVIVNDVMPSLMNIFQTVYDVITRISENWSNNTNNIFKVLFDLIINNTKGALKIIEGIIKVFGGILSGDFSLIKEGLLGIWEGLWGNITRTVETAWGVIKSIINVIIDGINGLVNRLNRVSFSIPDWVPVIGGKSWGFNIPNIPKLAKGGDIIEGGSVMVGERGPEILDLPAGARVRPLGNDGPVTIIIEMDGRMVAKTTLPYLSEEVRLKTGLAY